jgi:uncharacterized protein (DUF924 family)
MDKISRTKPDSSRLIEFWRDAGPERWFGSDPEFDHRFRQAFACDFAAAVSGRLDHWLDTADSALALVILLDQYPRNSFRNTLWMYGTDQAARVVADMAINKGFDLVVEGMLSVFFYLPFGHSEILADQERAVTLCKRLGGQAMSHSQRHMDIIKRFGRFPHRNPILGRKMRAEEQEYLDNGGFAG